MLSPSTKTNRPIWHREWDEYHARQAEQVRAQAQRLADEWPTADLLEMNASAIMGQSCDRDERMSVLALAIELKRASK